MPSPTFRPFAAIFFLFLFCSSSMSANLWACSTEDDLDVEKLKGKWSVVSVEHDGEFTPAQIGQREGDIISIVENDAAIVFS